MARASSAASAAVSFAFSSSTCFAFELALVQACALELDELLEQLLLELEDEGVDEHLSSRRPSFTRAVTQALSTNAFCRLVSCPCKPG